MYYYYYYISSRFSKNSEADISEYLENIEEMFLSTTKQRVRWNQ